MTSMKTIKYLETTKLIFTITRSSNKQGNFIVIIRTTPACKVYVTLKLAVCIETFYDIAVILVLDY
jgi:hypothetical protein